MSLDALKFDFKFDFDLEPLKAKYEEERLKRVRKEGKGQFRATKGELTDFEDDPYAERIERARCTTK